MNLESPKVNVQKSDDELFEFLSVVENFEKIMPEDTDKFEVKENGFLFALRGMPEIKVKMSEQIPSNKIVLSSALEQFPFNLIATITKTTEKSSEVQFNFDGKFNMMMAMMIKNPLQKFINTLAQNIEKL